MAQDIARTGDITHAARHLCDNMRKFAMFPGKTLGFHPEVKIYKIFGFFMHLKIKKMTAILLGS